MKVSECPRMVMISNENTAGDTDQGLAGGGNSGHFI